MLVGVWWVGEGALGSIKVCRVRCSSQISGHFYAVLGVIALAGRNRSGWEAIVPEWW